MAEFIVGAITQSRCLFTFVEKEDLNGLRHWVGEGADVDVRDEEGQTPLHMASAEGYLSVVTALLNLKGEVNAKDLRHVTPLHLACRGGHAAVVHMLVIHGADIHAEDLNMKTPLYESCNAGHGQIVDFLLKEEVLPVSLRKALIPAVRHGFLEIVEKLLQHGTGMVPSGQALFLACQMNSVPMVKVLVRNGADLKYKDEETCATALHVAAGIGHSMGVVRLLLDNGADLEAKSSNGMTPLFWACEKPNLRNVHLLLRRGADVNVQYRECTPLHLAVAHQNLDLVNMLLSHKANANARDTEGAAPLHWACDAQSVEIVETLLRHGANPNLVATEHFNIPLVTAVWHSSSRMVKALLEFSAQVDTGPDIFRTPMGLACTNERCDIIRLLLKYGQPLKPDRKRLLMGWIRHNEQWAVLNLLRLGTDVDLEGVDP